MHLAVPRRLEQAGVLAVQRRVEQLVDLCPKASVCQGRTRLVAKANFVEAAVIQELVGEVGDGARDDAFARAYTAYVPAQQLYVFR